MSDALNFGIDFIISLCNGIWFASFFKGLEKQRGVLSKWDKGPVVILAAQYIMVRMLFWWFEPLKQLIYGKNMYMMDVRQSIPQHMIFFMVSLLCVCLVFREKIQLLVYLTVAWYALEEMVRFILLALGDFLLNMGFDRLNYAMMEEKITPEQYYGVTQVIQNVWGVSMNAVLLVLLGAIAYAFRKEFNRRSDRPGRQEIHFLMTPGIIGMGLGILLRGVIYKINGTQVFNLLSENPEVIIVLPLVSGLCMASIIGSLVILRRLEEAYAEKAELQVYRQRAEDMEAYIQEMEHLYDGIREVKHDIKNYAMDLEGLLQSADIKQPDTGEELQGYLDGLYHSMEKLDMRHTTGNVVADEVINRHFREAQSKGIRTECDFLYPKEMGIGSFDLAVILNNALENAREACELVGTAVSYIRLTGECKGNFLILKIENSFIGHITEKQQNGVQETGIMPLPRSSKPDALQHGIGMKNIAKCAQKYGGTLQWEAKEGRFLLTVLLQKKVL